jgi:hypothetical protein
LVLGILHGVKDKFPDDVSGAVVGTIFNGHKLESKKPLKMESTAAPETSSGNIPYTPYKNPKTKNQYSFPGECLKSKESYELHKCTLLL